MEQQDERVSDDVIDDRAPVGDAAELSAAVLAEEAVRRHEQRQRDEVVVTDALPGVGGERMGLHE
jgi:hypothetical protein